MEPEVSQPALPPRPNVIFFYDRGLRAGWRLLIYCGMIFLLVTGVGLVVKLLGGGARNVGEQPLDSRHVIVLAFAELVPFLVLLFFAWVMSKIERRKVGAYGLPLQKSLFRSFGTGYLFWGFLPLALVLLILRALHVFYFGGFSKLNAQMLGWGILWGVFFLFVGLFEEFSFRGYFLYTLTDGIGFWPAAIIQAILFARVHMGNSGETKVGIVATALFALFAAVTLWRTGNLWLAVGAHAGWDWGQSFFFGVSDSGLKASGHLLNPTITGPVWLSGGTVGPEGSVVTLILWALMTIIFVLIYRKRAEPALLITQAPKY
jgi:CAAX protease family protein